VSAYEAVELALILGNRIDFHWGLFITVHLALFGAIVYIDRPLRRVEKLASLMLYVGFATVNYLQMSNQVNLLDAIYADITELSIQDEHANTVVIQHLATEAERGQIPLARRVLVFSHVIMLILVALSVIFDGRIIQRE
jgi:hypothetical protein